MRRDSTLRELILAITIVVLTFAYALLSLVPPPLVIPARDPLLDLIGDYIISERFYIDHTRLVGPWRALPAPLEEGLRAGVPRLSTSISGKWREVSLPLKLDDMPSTGLWLAATFELPKSFEGRRVHVFFKLAAVDCHIWVNGYYAGLHRASPASFSLEITHYVRLNGLNSLVLFLDPGRRLPGYGVVIDEVELYSTGDVQVKAVLARLMGVSDGSATLKVDVVFENLAGAPLNVELRYELSSGAELLGEGAVCFRVSGQRLTRQSFTIDVANPPLWYPLGPNRARLCTLELRVMEGGEFSGSAKVRLGLRTLLSTDNRLLVNGEPTFLRGVAIRSGEASSILELLRAGNATFNFLHLLGPSELLPQLAQACDEKGVLLAVGLQERAEPRLQLAYMLLLYNHPSFAMWIEEGAIAGITQPWAGAEVAIYSLKPPTARLNYVFTALDYRPVLRREEAFRGGLDEALQYRAWRREYLLEAALAGTVGGRRRAVSMWLLANKLRADKFAPLGGFSLVVSAEELPWIRDSLKPSTILLELGGDYTVTEEGLELNPALGIYLRVKVANDDPYMQPGEHVVRVEVLDQLSGRVVSAANATVEVKPHWEAYGESVFLKLGAPSPPQRKAYELRASLLKEDRCIAAIGVGAYVVPEHVLRIRFDRHVEGVLVIVASPGASGQATLLVTGVSGREAAVELPGVEEFTAIGPFSPSEPLVPYSARFNVEAYNGSESLVEWPVERGTRLVIKVVPPLHGPTPRLSVSVKYVSTPPQPPTAPFTRLSTEDQLKLAGQIPELYFAAGSVTLPPGGEVEVTVRYAIGGRESLLTKRLRPTAGETIVISDIADSVFEGNGRVLEDLRSGVEALVESLEERGYYLGGSRYMLSLVEELLASARQGDRLMGGAAQRQAYALLSQLNSYLLHISRGPSLWYTTFIIVAVFSLSVLVGWTLFTKEHERMSSSFMLFTVLMALSSQLLPGLKMGIEAAAAIAVAAGLLLALITVARSPSVGGLKTASGASLEGILASMISLSVNLLSRRRLRALLLLVTVSTVSAGVTSLTSFTAYSWVGYQLVKQPPGGVGESYLVVTAKSPAGPLDPTGLSVLEGREEVEGVALSAIALYPMNPLEVVGGVPVAGILGVSENSPLTGLLGDITSPSSAVDVVGGGQGFILISDSMARALGKDVGDVVVLRGRRYVIAGRFDSRGLADMKDLDGRSVIPPVIVGYISTRVSAESVVIMNYRDALLLGAGVNKVYVRIRPGAECDELARALSILGGYSVYVAEPGEPVRAYFPSTKFEFIGAEMAVPAAVSLLIVFSAFVGFAYEMRREIFTLSTLGATPDQLFLLFLIEAGLIGFAGGVAGYVAGLATFKLFGLLGVLVPVDVKVSLAAAAISILSPIVISVLGALLPASRAVTIAVPSLRRRWTPEAELVERRAAERALSFRVSIPVIIGDEEKARSFVEHVASRLSELSSHKVTVYNVDVSEDYDEWGRRAFRICFEYAQVEGRAFKSHNTIWVRWRDGHYAVEMESEIITIFTLFANECLRDVTSLVREVALEWSAEGERIAAMVYRSRDVIREVVNAVNPRYLLVLTREDPGLLKAFLRYALGGAGHRVMLDVRRVKFGTFWEAVEELKRHLADVEAVYINSDDAFLSAAALLAAAKLSKRILVRDPGGEVTEVKLS